MLRRGEQAAAALLVAAAILAMAAWWIGRQGMRGELIEIDLAAPEPVQFAVDINQAEWPELALLPEVGETLAKRIVAERETGGAFRDHADLRRVRGIGPRTLERITPYLLPMPPESNVAGQPFD